MKVNPITPLEARRAVHDKIPDYVIAAFNKLIISHLCGLTAVVSQEDVLTVLAARGIDRREAFAKGWLNIETLYEAAGWHVEYDRPGYNETGEAFFRFTAVGDKG